MRQRAKLRKWCKPMGPIGLLLESVHLQAASIDPQWRVCQYNQTPIHIVEGPAQLLSPLLLRAAARNRTARAEGGRKETTGLLEIDTYATNAKHKEEVPKEKKAILRYMQSGSNWCKALTAKTGRTDCCTQEENCDICKTHKEDTDHIWFCPVLKSKAREIDVDLAEIDPECIPPSLRKGIAPAMGADPTGPFWGGGRGVFSS